MSLATFKHHRTTLDGAMKFYRGQAQEHIEASYCTNRNGNGETHDIVGYTVVNLAGFDTITDYIVVLPNGKLKRLSMI